MELEVHVAEMWESWEEPGRRLEWREGPRAVVQAGHLENTREWEGRGLEGL